MFNVAGTGGASLKILLHVKDSLPGKKLHDIRKSQELISISPSGISMMITFIFSSRLMIRSS